MDANCDVDDRVPRFVTHAVDRAMTKHDTPLTRWWRRPSQNGAVVLALVISAISISSGLWTYQHYQDVAQWHDCVHDAGRVNVEHDVLTGLITVAIDNRPPSPMVENLFRFIDQNLVAPQCGDKPRWL